MKLLAKNEKQLDACLKLLYSEGINNLPIDVFESESGKIHFHVIVSVDEEKFNSIQKKYDILISK